MASGAGDGAHCLIPSRPPTAGEKPYDFIVVGGGIYGAMLLLEGSLRGLRGLLAERDDFGAATTSNHLRIVHGGLRYLQQADLRRSRVSAIERAWFLDTFPDCIEPLQCLMPLYRDSIRHPAIVRLALMANEFLSSVGPSALTAGSAFGSILPRGGVLSPAETIARCDALPRAGLRGGALWYDGVITSPERLVIEILRWARSLGSDAANYTEVRELLIHRGRTVGVLARDRAVGADLRLESQTVFNCAGPWCRQFGARCDRDVPALFRPSLAFNVLLNRRAPSPSALAVRSRERGAPTYFLVPWRGRLLAGTCHLPWTGSLDARRIERADVERFVNALNHAVPSLNACLDDVARVMAGFLPASAEGSGRPSRRPVIVDHGAAHGPAGLFSISGVKLTTARRVASRALDRAFGRQRGCRVARLSCLRPAPNLWPDLGEALSSPTILKRVRALASAESVIHLTDLVLRRTAWHEDDRVLDAASRLGAALGWSSKRREYETAALKEALHPFSFGREFVSDACADVVDGRPNACVDLSPPVATKAAPSGGDAASGTDPQAGNIDAVSAVRTSTQWEKR